MTYNLGESTIAGDNKDLKHEKSARWPQAEDLERGEVVFELALEFDDVSRFDPRIPGHELFWNC